VCTFFLAVVWLCCLLCITHITVSMKIQIIRHTPTSHRYIIGTAILALLSMLAFLYKTTDGLGARLPEAPELSASASSCSIGSPPWKNYDHEIMLNHMKTFNEIWTARPGGDNDGGGGFFHYFALYNIIKSTKPTTIIESGAHRGVGTWFLRQMAGNDTHIIVVSPQQPQIYVDRVGDGSKSTYFTGSKFEDFNSIKWNEVVDDPKTTLVFIDDHQAGIRRMEEAKARGFKHIVFDDNYPPGEGDNMSGKWLCDPKLWSVVGRDEEYTYVDNFGQIRKPITTTEYLQYVDRFNGVASVYAEFPPVWEGPSRFYTKDITDKITQPPLFSNPGDLSFLDENTMAKKSFDSESKKYTWILYVGLS